MDKCIIQSFNSLAFSLFDAFLYVFSYFISFCLTNYEIQNNSVFQTNHFNNEELKNCIMHLSTTLR